MTTRRKMRKTTCRFCKHQIGVAFINRHEDGCQHRSPERREAYFQIIETARRKKAEDRKNNAKPDVSIDQVVELRTAQQEKFRQEQEHTTQVSELTEILTIAQKIAALNPGDRKAILELIS